MEAFRFGFDFQHIQQEAARISKKVLFPGPRRHRHRGHRGSGVSKRAIVRTVVVTTVMKKYTANTFSLQLNNKFDMLVSV